MMMREGTGRYRVVRPPCAPLTPRPSFPQHHADPRHECPSGDEPGDELVGRAVRGHPHQDADDGQAHPARNPQNSAKVAVRTDEVIHLGPGQGRSGNDDDDDSHRADLVQQAESPCRQEEGRQEEGAAVDDRLRQTGDGAPVSPMTSPASGAFSALGASGQAGPGDR